MDAAGGRPGKPVGGTAEDRNDNGGCACRCVRRRAEGTGLMSDFADYATVFKALSDPLRLRLLSLLPPAGRKRTFCVCDLAQKLGMSQPCLSHHLNILKRAGLVGFKKDGCTVYYYVDRDEVLGKLGSFQESLKQA